MMKYQLVLQLPASSVKDYDEMILLEEIVIRGIGGLGSVDGHDAGSGEMNIFIHTDQPKAVFGLIESLQAARDFLPRLKAAFREMGEDEFTILHPVGLDHFANA